MTRALHDRFWETLTLALSGSGREAGAVYLFGYVVEMLLKVAYFRQSGIARHEDTTRQRRIARQLAAGYRRRNDHDLIYWVFVLERVRVANGDPIDAVVMGGIYQRVGVVATNWTEMLRYRDFQPTQAEMEEVFRSVEWLLAHQKEMWG